MKPDSRRLTIDTNVLVYAESAGDEARCETARQLLARLPQRSVVLPVQVLGELQNVLTRRYRRDPAIARAAVLSWTQAFDVAASSWAAMQAALELSVRHQLSIWDALILAVAAEQRCELLLSEDLQSGFTWRGVTVVNPFAEPLHPLLEDWLT